MPGWDPFKPLWMGPTWTFKPRIEGAHMSRKTTILITAVAAISIGALGAGAAVGFVDGPLPFGPAAQSQVGPPGGFGPGAQFAEVGPEAPEIPGRPSAGNGARFAPAGQEAANAVARRGGRQAAAHQRGGRPGGEDRDLGLTADQAGTLISAQLIMQGNDRLKVGGVVSQGEDTYVVDIVTVDDSLVMQIEVDRDSGRRSIIR
jgi:hypothetical protein